MGLLSDDLAATIEVDGSRGRTWLCHPVDRSLLWRLGLLQAALGLAVHEAGQVAQLLHLDQEERDAVLAANDAAAPGAPATAQEVARRDELLAETIFGCRLNGQEAKVKVVLQREDADPDATPERVWVGALPLVDIIAIANALLAAYRGEVRDGVTFRSAPRGAAGAS